MGEVSLSHSLCWLAVDDVRHEVVPHDASTNDGSGDGAHDTGDSDRIEDDLHSAILDVLHDFFFLSVFEIFTLYQQPKLQIS